MHLSLGTTKKGIIGGYVISLCAALATALQTDTNWREVVAGVLIISGTVIGALLDPGSDTKA